MHGPWSTKKGVRSTTSCQSGGCQGGRSTGRRSSPVQPSTTTTTFLISRSEGSHWRIRSTPLHECPNSIRSEKCHYYSVRDSLDRCPKLRPDSARIVWLECRSSEDMINTMCLQREQLFQSRPQYFDCCHQRRWQDQRQFKRDRRN